MVDSLRERLQMDNHFYSRTVVVINAELNDASDGLAPGEREAKYTWD